MTSRRPMSQPIHRGFFDKQLFDRAVNKFAGTPDQSMDIRGGIIPHHLLASEIIANFFAQLPRENIETIVIIGPNHHEQGNADIISGVYSWETPYGKVESDSRKIRQMEKSGATNIDDNVLDNEHSLGSLMPFIRYYIPRAKVVPIAVSRKLTDQEAKTLAASLEPLAKSGRAVVIASVDFSHYLPAHEAEEKDQESIRAIIDHDYSQLLMFGNDHLDSPGSVITLLKVMSQAGATDHRILDHTNSGRLLKEPDSATTSYYGIAYY